MVVLVPARDAVHLLLLGLLPAVMYKRGPVQNKERIMALPRPHAMSSMVARCRVRSTTHPLPPHHLHQKSASRFISFLRKIKADIPVQSGNIHEWSKAK